MDELEYAKAAYEVNLILTYFDPELVNKIPDKMQQFLKEVAGDVTTDLRIDETKKLKEHNLLPSTELMLTTLYLNYWCSEEEKKELEKTLDGNEKKHQEELREKYNQEDLFENKNDFESPAKEKASMIGYKKTNLITTILKRLQKLFNKSD
ncbi:MAG: hypothetical protein FWC79_05605 [Oscillospiraceae bacterium]|nr:hypothetical protein [Oscillospiraceae bacterium]